MDLFLKANENFVRWFIISLQYLCFLNLFWRVFELLAEQPIKSNIDEQTIVRNSYSVPKNPKTAQYIQAELGSILFYDLLIFEITAFAKVKN